MGTLLVQLARAAGGRVVAAAGSAHKVDIARQLGAELGVNYGAAGWAEQVRKTMGGV